MSWRPKTAKLLIEQTAEEALSKSPIDQKVEVYVDTSLNKSLDDYILVPPQQKLPENDVEMIAKSDVVFQPLPDISKDDDDNASDPEDLPDKRLDGVCCLFKDVPLYKNKIQHTHEIDKDDADLTLVLDKIEAAWVNGAQADFDTITAHCQLESKKWTKQLKKYCIQQLKQKLCDKKDNVDFTEILEDVTKYGLRTASKEVKDAIEADVTRTVNQMFGTLSQSLWNDKPNIHNEVINQVLHQELQKERNVSPEILSQSSVEIQTEPYISKLYADTIHWNSANTSACESPHSSTWFSNTSQPVDPVILNKRLNDLVQLKEKKITDSIQAFDPTIGLIVQDNGQHDKLIECIEEYGYEHSEMFENVKLDPLKDYIVQTLFWKGIWYKLVLEKTLTEECGEVTTTNWFVGCWRSSVIPSKRQKRKALPLTQEEYDAIIMPPPKLPYIAKKKNKCV